MSTLQRRLESLRNETDTFDFIAKVSPFGPPKTKNENRANQIASGVEAMKLDDTPRAKSKNLDVLKEFEKAKSKNAANFVVIGMAHFPRVCTV